MDSKGLRTYNDEWRDVAYDDRARGHETRRGTIEIQFPGGGTDRDARRSEGPARPLRKDAPRLLRGGKGQDLLQAEQVRLRRVLSRAREVPDRDRDAPPTRKGLVLPVLPREGAHGRPGHAAQGHLPRHALARDGSELAGPEHVR